MNLFLTETTTAAGGMTSTLIMLVMMMAIFYFMLIRPENKRKKEAEAMRSAVKVGDKITTIGGICGTVVNVKDDKLVLETGADQVRIELAKWAMSTNETAAEAKKARDREIADVFEGKSDKLLLVIGPCSADSEEPVMEYIHRLRVLQDKVSDKILMIPRIYTN